MKQRNFVFVASAFLFLAVFSAPSLRANQKDSNTPSKADIIQKTKKLQIPFIANEGQADERVKFYANTFGGTVFVTKDGEIVYALPGGKNEALGNAIANGHSPLPGLEQGKDATAVAAVGWVKRSEPNKTLALKETLTGGKISGIKGEENAVTNVSYFKGKDPSKWKANIPTFEVVNLGEVYGGIELKLKAYGNNVEKLFCVKPGADPDRIKIQLSGVNDGGVQTGEDVGWVKRSAPNKEPNPTPQVSSSDAQNPKLQINKSGQLVAKTGLVPVKFTKPIAYQEINGKRVEVDCKYVMRDRAPSSVRYSKNTNAKTEHTQRTPPTDTDNGHRFTYGFAVASYDQTKDLIIDPLLASTCLGGSLGSDSGYSLVLDTSGNVYVAGYTDSTDFPTTSGAYDTSQNGSDNDYANDYDVFVSKLDGRLTSLLASTYLGGFGDEGNSGGYTPQRYHNDGCSLALDISGNVYVAGYTKSTDFPTTNGAYDTSFNGSYDVFVSKLDGGLTSLLASTYLGGSSWDYGESIALDTSGNVYVTGYTPSENFPTTSGAYDTTSNGSDVFISKLDSELTTLLSSTLLGYGYGYSLALDTSGNVYVTGYTNSSTFPTTSGAYDTSYNVGSSDVFVSKLDGRLTSLLASTYLGGSLSDCGYSLALDSSGNIYVAGYAESKDYPTTSGAYDTSNYYDAFISKLDGGLTSLLASTYLGGSGSDNVNSLALDTGGNVYVTGNTSGDFPTTSGAYLTSLGHHPPGPKIFVSKLDGGLTSLLASTYLDEGAAGYSLALDTSGNVYVTGQASGDFQTTSGAYDTSSGGDNVFISKLDSNLSAPKPEVKTSSASNVAINSATLNGTVNANGTSTTAWFQYDTASGSYANTSSTQTVTGTSDTTVSISISGLSSGTTYYYRIAAQSSIGTVYGSETSFTTLSDIATPTGSLVINGNAAYTNSPNVILSLSATDNVGIMGYYLSTSASTPSASDAGWTSVTATTNYSSNVSYTLSSGDGNKTVYVWYKDSSGNISNSASDSITLDTAPPTITITSPTSSDTYTVTSSVIAIGGNATDDTSDISAVAWSNDKGGSGTANGTTSWLTSSISLLSGENVITVTAIDGAGNTGTDNITVTYSTGECRISGYVSDRRDNPIASAKINLKGTNSKILNKTISDEDGFFEFADLSADTYIITAIKKGYKNTKQTVILEAGEEKDIEIVMKKGR